MALNLLAGAPVTFSRFSLTPFTPFRNWGGKQTKASLAHESLHRHEPATNELGSSFSVKGEEVLFKSRVHASNDCEAY